jgi:hypothetical protein
MTRLAGELSPAERRRIALDAARDALAALDRLQAEPALELTDVRRVVAIVASSRGGSSLLHRLLSDHPDALSIGGEHTVVYKLSGLERGADGSDVLDVRSTLMDQRQLAADFMALLSAAPATTRWRSTEYAATITRRLALQWPLEKVTYASVLRAVKSVGSRRPRADATTVFSAVLDHLAVEHPGLDRHYYDLPSVRGRAVSGRCEPPAGGFFIEEPPFVAPAPRTAPTADDLARKPVVIKASVDAYRLPLLRRIFPEAEIRLVHLTRNPAASINGLYDGWRDRGFFSYDVSDQALLSIPGYSELTPPARRWWNFDIPPDWRQHVASPLEYVCAAQWRGAHIAILESLNAAEADRILRLALEEVLDLSTRATALARLFAFVGLDPRRAPDDLPVVMATTTPRRARWRERAGNILPALDDQGTRAVARELGYPWEGSDAWILRTPPPTTGRAGAFVPAAWNRKSRPGTCGRPCRWPATTTS